MPSDMSQRGLVAPSDLTSQSESKPESEPKAEFPLNMAHSRVNLSLHLQLLFGKPCNSTL